MIFLQRCVSTSVLESKMNKTCWRIQLPTYSSLLTYWISGAKMGQL